MHSQPIARAACYRRRCIRKLPGSFEHTLALRLNGDSWRDQILRVTLDGVAERGFHLIHAALYGELLGFITRHSAETV